jgi:hypothetical protein
MWLKYQSNKYQSNKPQPKFLCAGNKHFMEICENLHVFSMPSDLWSPIELATIGTSASSFEGDEHENYLSSYVFG